MTKNSDNATGRENRFPLSRGAGFTFTAAILSVFVVSLASGIIISLITSGKDVGGASWYIFLSYFLASFAVVISLIIGGCFFGAPTVSLIRPRFDKKFALIALLAFVGMYFGLGGINDYVSAIFYKIGLSPESGGVLPPLTPLNFCLSVVIVAVIPAVAEEILFRGVILNGLRSAGEKTAIIVSAALFSLYHMSPVKTVYQFMAGLVFALIAVKSGSLVPTIAMHLLNNLAVIVNYYFIGFAPTGWLGAVITVAGIAVLAVAVFLAGKTKTDVVRKESASSFAVCALPGIVAAAVMWIAAFF